MSSLDLDGDLDLDTQRIHLEFEWRAGYEASIIARIERLEEQMLDSDEIRARGPHVRS